MKIDREFLAEHAQLLVRTFNEYGIESFRDLGRYHLAEWPVRDSRGRVLIDTSSFKHEYRVRYNLLEKRDDQGLTIFDFVRSGKDMPFVFTTRCQELLAGLEEFVPRSIDSWGNIYQGKILSDVSVRGIKREMEMIISPPVLEVVG